MRSIVGAAMTTAASLVYCALFCAGAPAEVGVPAGTVQQAASNALFLQYAPPPPTPGIVCLVDSGVDPNPDTTPILAGSRALAANTNAEDELAALDPALPGGHGTYMAMVAAAPVNGWGMVGIAPSSVHVFNMKALATGQTTFSFSEYGSAIRACQALTATMPVSVVNLSLGSATQPTGEELQELEDYVRSAHKAGLGVVAAVGNQGGAVEAPAYLPEVLGIGASNANPANVGVMCSFSNSGPGLTMLAPGCGSQTELGGNGIEVAFSSTGEPAWATGTSYSAIIVSAVEASMRAYSPTLTYAQVQGCVTSTLTGGSNLDVAAAFDECGLEQIVNEGTAAYQTANSVPASSDSGPPAAPLILPQQRAARKPKIVKITFKKHRLTIRVADIPKRSRLKIIVQVRDDAGRFITLAHAIRRHTTITLRVTRWDRIVARFLSGHTRLPALVVSHRKRTRTRLRWARRR
jgi:Subtilase family